MNSIIVSMLAETFIHPGSGQNVGAIDLPVAREAATDYPYIAGSSLKGALRDAYEQYLRTNTEAHVPPQTNDIETDNNAESDEATEKDPIKKKADGVFGDQAQAGNIIVSDARLLLLPVRSLSGAYKWVTCGHLLERFLRDLERSGSAQPYVVPTPEPNKVLTTGTGKLFLEELSFDIQDGQDDAVNTIVTLLTSYLPTSVSSRLASQLAILTNNDFAWFARYGLAVQARNNLDENKTSKNLWYEESIPPDTLMYTVLAERRGEPLSNLANIGHYLQVGGNETVGQGWFRLQGLEANHA